MVQLRATLAGGVLLAGALLFCAQVALKAGHREGKELLQSQPEVLAAARTQDLANWNSGVLAGTASLVKACAHGINAACDKLISDPGVVHELKKVNSEDQSMGGWLKWAGLKAAPGQTEMLWENYFPGYRAVRARYERTKQLLKARDQHHEAMGLPKKTKEQEQQSMANPYVFCKKSFPPQSLYDQAEFRACQEALGLDKVVDLQNVGDSSVATDITGAPAGYHQVLFASPSGSANFVFKFRLAQHLQLGVKPLSGTLFTCACP